MTDDSQPPFPGGRIKELKPLSFIYEVAHALKPDTCREMIQRFEARVDQQVAGRIGQAGGEAPEVKHSTDLRISGREDWRDIDRTLSQQLVATFNEFGHEFPFFSANSFKDIGYNLQRTLPGEYYHWHVDAGPGAFSERQLVAIWYPQRRPGSGRRDRVCAAGGLDPAGAGQVDSVPAVLDPHPSRRHAGEGRQVPRYHMDLFRLDRPVDWRSLCSST